MHIFISVYKPEANVTSYAMASIAYVDGEVWAVYNDGPKIMLVKENNGVWSTPVYMMDGTSPNISYDNVSTVTIYFENGKKIQSLEISAAELGAISPLQTWDAVDCEFAGFGPRLSISDSWDQGIQVVSMFDDFPHYQPIPTNFTVTGVEATWTHTLTFPNATRKYRLYKDGVLLIETDQNTYTFEAEPLSTYTVTSVYVSYEIEYESFPASYYLENALVSKLKPDFTSYNLSSIIPQLVVSYDVDSMSGDDTVTFGPAIMSGFNATDLSFKFSNYEVDSLTLSEAGADNSDVVTFGPVMMSGFNATDLSFKFVNLEPTIIQ